MRWAASSSASFPAPLEHTAGLLAPGEEQVQDDLRESTEHVEQPDGGGDLTEAFCAVAPDIDSGSDLETTDCGSASPAPEKVDFARDNKDVDAALVALWQNLSCSSKTRVSVLMPHFLNYDKAKFENAKRRIMRVKINRPSSSFSTNSGNEEISK